MLSPSEVWWHLLLRRLEQLTLRLPRHLVGVVQFELEQPDAHRRYHHLILGGGRFEPRVGIAAGAGAWVALGAGDAQRFLDQGELAEGALRVAGDADLACSLFAALACAHRPMSQIALRSQR
jgi:hypothetical protein